MSSVMDTLVTDRTSEDVERLQELTNRILTEGWDALTENEQAEYSDPANKGAYNLSDLRRVGNAGEHILYSMSVFATQYTAYLSSLGLGGDPIYEIYYDPANLSYVWPVFFSEMMIVYKSVIRDWLNGLEKVRALAVNPDNLPTLPTMEDMAHADYSTANDIERMLSMVWDDFQAYTLNMYHLADMGFNSIPYSDEFAAGELGGDA